MEKLVTIVIPTYARPTNLCRAIDSVLSQDYKNVEIIVVDDNGIATEYQKLTEQILSKYIANKKITYLVHNINMNGSAARNTGLANSNGEYIAFLDDDDSYSPKFISECMKVLEASPHEIGAVYCNSTWVLQNGTTISKNNTQSGNIISQILLRKCTCSTSTILFRKSVCEALGGFDTQFRRHQDWEFLVRFFRNYRIKLVNQNLLLKYTTITPGSNVVDAMKMYEIKKLFFETYKSDIDALPESNEIYSLHWKEVAFLLSRQGYWSRAYNTLRLANNYSTLSMKDYVTFTKKLILSIVYRKQN